MTALPGGLLLPSSVLTSTWFLVLATIVAFNTIVYLGLTASKFVPWPHQLHPDEIRRYLRKVGIAVDESTTDGPLVEAPESDDPYEAMRLAVARREIPQAMAAAGGLAILYALAGIVTFGLEDIGMHVFELVGGVGMLVLSVVLGHRPFAGRTMMRVWVAVCVALVVGLVWEAHLLDSETPMLYSLLIITAFAPVCLAWRPSIIGGLLMVASLVVGALVVPGVEDLRIGLIAVVALLVGLGLLRARLSALDLVSDEQARISEFASTDPLTQALSRRGVLTLVEGLGGNAARTGQDVCVIVVQVADLTTYNDEYGYTYGDDVLRAVSAVLRDRSRVGDLVARWTGDKFLVTGMGYRPDPRQYEGRIDSGIRLTGVDLGRPPVRVRVGTAAGAPADVTFEQLVADADEDLRAGGTQPVPAESAD